MENTTNGFTADQIAAGLKEIDAIVSSTEKKIQDAESRVGDYSPEEVEAALDALAEMKIITPRQQDLVTIGVNQNWIKDLK